MTDLKLTSLNAKGVTPLFSTVVEHIPSVFFTAEVIRAIEYIVYSQAKEVAWMGLVEKLEDNNYLVYKLYVPKQTVTAASVDIDADAIAKLTMQILDEGHNPEHLRYHGHSHVNMTVFPSVTDQDHMADYLEHAPFFIREIRNKKQDSRVDIFDKEANKIYHCVDTDIYDLMQSDEFYAELDNVFKQMIADKPSITSLYQRKTTTPLLPNLQNNDLNKKNDVLTYEDLLADPFYATGT